MNNLSDTEKQNLINYINDDPNTTIEIEKEPTIFGYDKILKETKTNTVIGYKYIKTYEWEQAYNNEGIFGGWNCINIIEELEALYNGI